MSQTQTEWFAKETLIKWISTAQDHFFGEGLTELDQMPSLKDGLKADFGQGLKGDDINERIRLYGDNRRPVTTFRQIFFEQFRDFITQVLIVIGILLLIENSLRQPSEFDNGSWFHGFSLIFGILIKCGVTSWLAYTNKKQMEQFSQLNQFICFRNGEQLEMKSEQIVVGDVIIIKAGTEVPADGLIIYAKELTIDESAITGDSQPIQKEVLQACIDARKQLSEEDIQKNSSDLPSPVALQGTKVVTGAGIVVVLAVGQSCYINRISRPIEIDGSSQTPLQAKLAIYSTQMWKFAQYSAYLIVLILLIRFILQPVEQNSITYDNVGDFINVFITGIAMLIIVNPKCIDLTLSLCMAYSTKNMLRDSILVRKTQSTELIGTIDTICTEKTGILTENKLALVEMWYNSAQKEINSYSRHQKLNDYLSNDVIDKFTVATITGTANLNTNNGSKTDIALLQFMENCDIDSEEIQEKYSDSKYIPFTSSRKRASIIIDNIIYMKGSSEIVIGACSQYHTDNDSTKPITESIKLEIETVLNDMASRGLRTIAIAYKNLAKETDIESVQSNGVYEVEKSDFVLIAILSFRDRLRQEIPRAIKLCQSAGIKVIMTTGDNQVIAKATGKLSGILIDDKSIVMEGWELNQKIGGLVCKSCQISECECGKSRVQTIQNKKTFNEIYPRLDILARCSPQDKFTLVTGLQERGHIVAVIGDGTGDAPAISKANIGFSLGIEGTEIARDSSDIILLDDQFGSVIKGVMWGRNIYESIRKLIQFQCTFAVVVVMLTIAGSFFLRQTIIKPIYLLWINIIMDTFACFAFAVEGPNQSLLNSKPEKPQENIVSPKMLKHVLGQSVYQLLVLIPTAILQESGRNGQQFPLILNLFFILQVFNLVNSTQIRDQINIFNRFFYKKRLIIMLISVVILQITILTVSGYSFNSVIQGLLQCFALGLGSLVWSLLIKYLPDINIQQITRKTGSKQDSQHEKLD